ncbi:hydrolase [Actinomadura sp. CNU-125]|uniref:HAD family hydrolase n=1 Tax=Actinomadura sp. CNU-125 TaxID=1904961 RepID=UPI0009612F6E|nr:HAD family hydrolase [Actinomadura sp. CNU-125]OLT36360.1 hydrolase [Actinomadura sp. CNU-125]
MRGVCFDLGGTLVRPEVEPTTGQVARVLGISLTEARGVMGVQAKRRRIEPADLADDLAAAFDSPELAGSLTHVLERARRRAAEPELFPDVADMLAALRRQGLALFALTNCLGSSIPEQMPTDLAPLLDGVVYSADTGAVKPERAAFAAVEYTAGLMPDQLLHVGDSLRADAAGADAAGWHSAWLDRQRCGGPLPVRTIRLHTLTVLPLLLPDRTAAVTSMTSMTSEAPR